MGELFFDAAIVGAGPGGYVAALRCAQWGLKTALIERAELGGTCLNEGCIPAKTLLHSCALFKEIIAHSAANGIRWQTPPTPDLPAIQARKDAVVKKLKNGIATLLDKRGVARLQGEAVLEKPHCLSVHSPETAPIFLKATHIVWAAGARPVELPNLPFDGQRIVSSRQALAFEAIPKNMAIVGAGAIGLEIASIWANLGSKVTILEAFPQIAPGFDPDVAQMAERFFKRLGGLSIETNARVKTFDRNGLAFEKNGKTLQIPAEKVLVAAGRAPETRGLAALQPALDERGRVVVDERFKTNVEGLYAIGDITPGPMLAHKAEAEGEAVARAICGKPLPPPSAIPAVIYTTPELACVGISQSQAQTGGIAAKIAKFPFAANGRALSADAPEGFVKLVGESATGRLLGAQILGPHAGELIATAAAHLAHKADMATLAHTITAHPTLSESLKEAALAWENEPLHIL